MVAVWIDCPGYALPIDYKQMSLAAMLDNVIRQLEDTHYTAFATSLPAGMFVDEHPSSLWKPSLYIQSAEVKKFNGRL